MSCIHPRFHCNHVYVCALCVQCFFQVCSPDTNSNRDQVEIYRQDHAQPGSTYPCFFDPTRVTNGAFFHRNIHWTLAFHVIAWPGLSLLGSVFMCIYIKYVRRKKSSSSRSGSGYNLDSSGGSQRIMRPELSAGFREDGERVRNFYG